MTHVLRNDTAGKEAAASWLDTLIASPKGIAALSGDGWKLLGAVVSGLTLERLVTRAETARLSDRIALYKLWIGLHPAADDTYLAWFNLGAALMQNGNAAEAAAAFATALGMRPDLHAARLNLALAQEAAGDRATAMATLRQGLPTEEERRMLHVNLGRMAEEAGLQTEALVHLRAALLIAPDQPDVIQHFVHLRQRMAEWPVLATDVPGVSPEAQACLCGPLGALAMHDDPALQREINAAWIARKVPPAPEHLSPPDGYDHPRIRVGYLSTDFCSHAMSYLIAELLERHDRTAFEVYGYCASPEDGSAIRRRVLAAMDHHVPIGALNDAAAAARIRQDEIDILVDLNGLTRGARLGLLRWKPAPVQVTYLGYIGPVALPELDWMITDRVAVPEREAEHYAPPPLWLDGCFQANDGQLPELPEVSREAEGLTADAFVFCCFSHHYKITPDLFFAWTRILAQCPGSVLWLAEDGTVSANNLRMWWEQSGLAAERLIFAPRVDPGHYRARMTLADLFLDTTPYNAGTIASDALRMGLPILTVEGRAFVARMATSLLTAMGLPELIAPDLAAYEARAVALYSDRDRFLQLRARCHPDLWSRTLGDAAGFTRRLEEAFHRIRRPNRARLSGNCIQAGETSRE